MKSTDDRKLFTTLIGADAAAGDIVVIPATQGTAGDGTASIADGFPAETFISTSAGGKRPRGQDVNGFLNLLSDAARVLQAENFGPYSSALSAAIGGYPLNAVVSAGTAGAFWVSTVEDNTTVPGNAGASWQSLFYGLAPLASPQFTGVPTVPTPAAGTNNTQAANTAWTKSNFAAYAGTASNGFFANTGQNANEADIGASFSGENDAYLYNNSSGWGLYSANVGELISYTRSGATVQVGSGLPVTVGTATGGNQAVAYSQLAGSMAVNGYQKLPSGLIIQWGRSATLSGTTSITFPISFPSAVFSVAAVVSGANSGGNFGVIELGAASLSGATFWSADFGTANTGPSNSDYSFNWIALGN